MFQNRLVLFTIVVGAGMMAALTASAFTISPPRFVLQMNPGESQVLRVLIRSSESRATIFRLGVVGVRQDEQGWPVFGADFDEAVNWIRPKIPLVTLLSGGSELVTFIVTIPPSALPGSPHYLGLVVHRESANGQATGLEAEIISLVSLQVAGVVRESLEIRSWQARSLWQFNRQWPFALELKNTGTAAVPLTGQIIITDSNGQERGRFPFTLGNRLLPQTSRILNPLVDTGQTPLSPGRYRVELAILFGNNAQLQIRQTTPVWYIPWWSLGGMAAAIVVGGWMGRRHLRRSPAT